MTTTVSVLQFASLIAAFVCFVLAANNFPARWNLLATGLALLTATQLLGRWPA